MGLLDLLLPGRRNALHLRRERAQSEFGALRDLWNSDSTGRGRAAVADGTNIEEDLRSALARHQDLLDKFRRDVDKFLYTVPVKLAKRESEYSWNFQRELDQEIAIFLNGILSGRAAAPRALGFLARCQDTDSYSREFLTAEIERRFQQRRAEPRPGFQLTLEYARSLDGYAFEE
jgi:hypothetical protein